MSIYGQISHHLIRSRETALAHEATSVIERLTIDAIVLQIDTLLVAVRKLHHQHHL